MPAKLKPYIDECKRQYDNCLYTSTSLYEHIKWNQRVRTVVVIIPLVLGSFAGWNVLSAYESPSLKIATAVCAFVAGLIPSVMSALKFDDNLDLCKTLASEYKNLQDRFRQSAQITSNLGIEAIAKELEALREQMESLRKRTISVPDWAFKRAQAKINKGDYSYDVDTDGQDTAKMPDEAKKETK